MNRREFIVGMSSSAILGCATDRHCPNLKLRDKMGDFIDAGLFGGIAAVSNHGEREYAGLRTLDRNSDPIDAKSLFDLASVGKTQTASLCALLYAAGKLDVDAPFTKYLPEHVLAKENCKITVRDLATHSGGFDNSKPYMTADPKRYFDELYAKRPVCDPGLRFCYACSNYVYLGLIVEKLTGLNLDSAAKQMLWTPLGMKNTTWNTIVGNPHAVEYSPSTYMTSNASPRRKIGEHNDTCAHLAPRPMGNGSCFSTATDMLRFCEDILYRKHFSKEYYELLYRPSYCGAGYRRSFGWDMMSEHSIFREWTITGFSEGAICHSGWTGSVIAIDPSRNFAGVVLSSQKLGKALTMGPRMELLELMAC